MFRLEMDQYGMDVEVRCIEADRTQVNSSELLQILGELLSALYVYETVNLTIRTKGIAEMEKMYQQAGLEGVDGKFDTMGSGLGLK